MKNIELEENFVEEQKKPKEKKAEGDEDFEIVKVKKSHTSNVNFNLKKAAFIPEEEIEKWTKLETDMLKRDNIIAETNRSKNDLESLIYNCKDRIGSDWAAYITEDEIKKISHKVHEMEGWMSSEG